MRACVYPISSAGEPIRSLPSPDRYWRDPIQVFLPLHSSPAIPSLATYVCWELWRTLMTAQRWFVSPAIAALLGIAIVFLASSCGQSTSSVKLPTPSAAPSPTPAAAASPSPPPGGPVPAQLLGDWFLPPAAVESVGYPCPSPPTAANCFFQLTLTATTYLQIRLDGIVKQPDGKGDVVVNNNEIDFFNDAFEGCLYLPDGVGRYTWTLTGGVLDFTLISDPCLRANVESLPGWSRTP
jgi:hypothetical protein